MNGQNALSKFNDNPQLVPATVITTNTPVVGLSHDLSSCADAVVAVVLTVSAYSGAGSVKLSLSGSEDDSTFTAIANDDLVIKDTEAIRQANSLAGTMLKLDIKDKYKNLATETKEIIVAVIGDDSIPLSSELREKAVASFRYLAWACNEGAK